MREQIERQLDSLPPSALERRVRPSPPRIAALALILVGASISIWYLARPDDSDGPTSSTSPALVLEARQARNASGEAWSEGDPVDEGDEMAVGGDGKIVVRFASGPTLVLGRSGRMVIERARGASRCVRLHEGSVRVSVPEETGAGSIEVTGRNARVKAVSTRFVVKARGGLLTETRVESGSVTVAYRGSEEVRKVSRGQRLVIHDEARERLAVGTETEPAGAMEPETGETEEIEKEAPSRVETAASVLADIRDALKEGDTQKAVALVAKHEDSLGNRPDFMLVSADVYRRAGMFQESVALYLELADKGGGKRSEVAFLRAAELQYREIKDASAASKTLDRYFASHPAGKLADEALVLAARVSISMKKYEKALGLLQSYLDRYPEGSAAAWAHLKTGWILEVHLGSCDRARPHLIEASKTGSGKIASSADKLLDACGEE